MWERTEVIFSFVVDLLFNSKGTKQGHKGRTLIHNLHHNYD
jgi:hypothetical protein